MKNRAVIFAGGEVLDYQRIRAELLPSDYILCADSGYKHCEKIGITPNILIGDFDSIEDIPQGIIIKKLAEDKDYTDTNVCLDKAIFQGFKEILLVGMLGGRVDHSLANVQLLDRKSVV